MKAYQVLSIFILSSILLWCSKGEESLSEIDLRKILQFGKEAGSEHEIIGQVRYICTDINNSLYVVDQGFNHIKKYDSNGQVEKIFGFGEGNGPGEFLAPRSIDVDKDLNLYVVDINQRRITVFNKSCDVIRTITTKMAPIDVAALNLNEVFITGIPSTYEGDPINKFNLADKNRAVVKLTFGKRYKDEKQFEIENCGNGGTLFKNEYEEIFLSLFYPYRIYQYSKNGKLLHEFSREVDFYKSPYLADTQGRYKNSDWITFVYTN